VNPVAELGEELRAAGLPVEARAGAARQQVIDAVTRRHLGVVGMHSPPLRRPPIAIR